MSEKKNVGVVVTQEGKRVEVPIPQVHEMNKFKNKQGREVVMASREKVVHTADGTEWTRVDSNIIVPVTAEAKKIVTPEPVKQSTPTPVKQQSPVNPKPAITPNKPTPAVPINKVSENPVEEKIPVVASTDANTPTPKP